MRENLIILLVMIVTVPLAGELKIHPFGDDFRVSFGTTAFFFFLLWSRRIPPELSGILVGLSVVLFRVSLDVMSVEHIQVEESIRHQIPALVYYVVYALLFSLARINQKHHRPLVVGMLGVCIEITSNMVELAFRSNYVESLLSVEIITKIAVIAFIRTFFALGFFNMIQLRQSNMLAEEQRIRNEHNLMLISNLYEESIQLKKTLQHVENITRECYDVYRTLNHSHQIAQADGVAQRVLQIAGQVHEIKKDNQRIYAGLSRMISNEHVNDFLNMNELVQIVKRTNQKYARLLSKDITFVLQVNVSSGLFHIYTILSLLNNLVTNAVEAIKDTGTITISVHEQTGWVELQVRDNGPGIKVKKRELLFTPGFTTKYDVSGKPSTGIGLSYVKEVVNSLHGTVEISSNETGETIFTIGLPLEEVTQRGENE